MKRSICIVEDDRDLREAMSLMIQFTEHYELVSAFQNAEEALEKSNVIEVDAVLMDINLPGDSGIECVRKWKALFPKVPFFNVYFV